MIKEFNQLKNLFSLDNKIRLFIPSTYDIDKKIDNKNIVKKIRKRFSILFGGSTIFNGIGSYVIDDQKEIVEDVKIIEAFASDIDLKNNIDKVLKLSKNLKKELKQDSVALEVNGKMYFI